MPRRSATSTARVDNPGPQAPALQAPAASGRASGQRQRTLTAKQQQNVIDQSEKRDAQQQRLYTEAIRHRQKDEELHGFRKTSHSREPDEEASLGPDISINVNSGQKSHPQDRQQEPQVSVSSKENTAEVHLTGPPTLVRRAIGPGPGKSQPASSPVMVAAPAKMVSTARPYAPHVQVEYGRDDESRGTFHSSRISFVEPELSDDEFTSSVPATPYQRPVQHHYPDVHSDPKRFSHSSTPNMRPPTPQPAGNPVRAGNVKRPMAPPSQPFTKSDRVRKEAPATAAASTTVIIKRPKVEGTGSRGRVKASDFDDLRKGLIEGAIPIYKSYIAAVAPFPERTEERDAVKFAWVEVCDDRAVRVELDEDIFKLIASRASQGRGQFKTVSKPYVIQTFGIDKLSTKREIRDKVEQLVDGARFIYKDPEAKSGLFRASIIQLLIDKMWFKSKEDDGVVNPEFSEDNMLALPTIALAMTMIENNLDEWVTGEHVDVPFTTATYKAKYRAHHKRLIDFHNKTNELEIIPRLRKHMLKMARKHAKVEDGSAGTAVAAFTDADIEAAKQEWEGMAFSDEE